MVGNMVGTSLAMAPAFLSGRLLQYRRSGRTGIPLIHDRSHPLRFESGFMVSCPDERLWGAP
jgi:hypothetical protein